MLIYNNNKEFVSVTEDTLTDLGYYNAHQLHEDAIDFADLLENRPGFVHNFKNFSWIDFLLHAEQDTIKARIRCNGKIFECGFKVAPYPMDNDEDGYAIELIDLITVGEDENSEARSQFDEPQAHNIRSIAQPVTDDKESWDDSEQEELDLASEPTEFPDFSEPSEFTEVDTQADTLPEFDDASLDAQATSLEDDLEQDEPFDLIMESSTSEQPVKQPAASKSTAAGIDPALLERLDLETPFDYSYDPSIAADELGLPADLIDEFVGDFIVQAKKFKPDLETALEKQDYDNIQILSHKLKGVAANLRIEDALEVLTFINTSQDDAKLKDHMEYLYFIINRLEFGADAVQIAADATPADTVAAQETLSDTTVSKQESALDFDLTPVDDEQDPIDFGAADSDEIVDFDLQTIESLQDNPADSDTELHFQQDDQIVDFDLEIKDTLSETPPAEDPLDIDFDTPELEIKDDMSSLNDEILTDDDFNFETAQEKDEITNFELTDQALEQPAELEDFDLPKAQADSEVDDVVSNESEKFDMNAAANALDIPMDTFKSYIDEFVDQANELKQELEAALTNHNLDEVKNVATQLKGMSEALNMSYATQLLSTLQTTDTPDEAIESAKKLFIFIREL